MELSRSWKAASCAAAQELLNILWNLRVHYRVHSTGPYSEPDQSNPYHPIIFL
jgi:hypothetical protein